MTIKRCYPVLVGASVAENQLCNGESVTVPNGHKFYLKKSGTESLGASTGTAITGLTSGTDMVIDLTQMLGSDIADYAYSLEQATAGSGIAWLRSYGFLKGYQAYNAGTIESVEVTGKKVVGFNQCDSMLEFGNIDSSGQNAGESQSYIRTIDYIRVISGLTYCFYASTSQQFMQLYVLEYDADKNFIARNPVIIGSILEETQYRTFTVRKKTHYVRMFIYKNVSFSTINNVNFCINLSSDRNGEYEPYHEYTYSLGSDVLRGIFKLDANNNLYADGDRKEADGTIKRKYGVVDLGTLDWINAGANKMFYANALNANIGGARAIRRTASQDEVFSWGIDSKALTKQSYNSIGTSTPNSICISTAGNILATLDTDTGYKNSTAFKTAMSGVMLVYELATPTTETSTPFTSPQICYPDGTEEFITENGVPVGHETEYQL